MACARRFVVGHLMGGLFLVPRLRALLLVSPLFGGGSSARCGLLLRRCGRRGKCRRRSPRSKKVVQRRADGSQPLGSRWSACEHDDLLALPAEIVEHRCQCRYTSRVEPLERLVQHERQSNALPPRRRQQGQAQAQVDLIARRPCSTRVSRTSPPSVSCARKSEARAGLSSAMATSLPFPHAPAACSSLC